MDQIVFKRKVVSGGHVELPQELMEFMELKEGTMVGFTADPRNGKSLKLWNTEVPAPERKKGKKN